MVEHTDDPGVGTLAARDDLVFENGPHPNNPLITGVFVRSRNQARGIVANVEIDAPQRQTLFAGDFLTSRARWPFSYEVRLPPGGRVLVGCAEAEIWQFIDRSVPDGAADRKLIFAQQFTITGAYYLDPPFPVRNENPLDFVWFYSVPMPSNDGSGYNHLQLAVSLHPNRLIEVEVYDRGDQSYFLFTIMPGRHMAVRGSIAPPRFDVRSARFVGPAATTAQDQA